jgi:hypothetical protein
MGIKGDGTLWTWETIGLGRSARGGTTDKSIPTQLQGISVWAGRGDQLSRLCHQGQWRGSGLSAKMPMALWVLVNHYLRPVLHLRPLTDSATDHTGLAHKKTGRKLALATTTHWHSRRIIASWAWGDNGYGELGPLYQPRLWQLPIQSSFGRR